MGGFDLIIPFNLQNSFLLSVDTWSPETTSVSLHPRCWAESLFVSLLIREWGGTGLQHLAEMWEKPEVG